MKMGGGIHVSAGVVGDDQLLGGKSLARRLVAGGGEGVIDKVVDDDSGM